MLFVRMVAVNFREIRNTDLTGIFAVRVATRENALSKDELTRLRITKESVSVMLSSSHCGWLCEVDEKIVGFAMGNRQTGEMWVIAVLPDYEHQGIGGKLLSHVEAELWGEGWSEIWLSTGADPSLRAYGFYLRQGWTKREAKDGTLYMRKRNSNKSMDLIPSGVGNRL